MVEKIKNNLSLVAIIFGLFASFMIFFPALIFNLEEFELEKILGGNADGIMFGITGWGVCFGAEIAGERLFDFSFNCLAGYSLPALAVIFLFAADNKQDKKYAQISCICFFVGAVLLFATPSLIECSNEGIKEAIEDYCNLGPGAFSGSVACLVSAFCVWRDLQNKPQVQEVFVEYP